MGSVKNTQSVVDQVTEVVPVMTHEGTVITYDS